MRASAQGRGAMAFAQVAWVQKRLVAPATFGNVHRLIGPAEQGAFMHSMIWVQRNPNAGLYAQGRALQVKRLRKRRQHFLRHGLWGFAQANPLQQHHEFIATEPCHRVAAAYAVHRLSSAAAVGGRLRRRVRLKRRGLKTTKPCIKYIETIIPIRSA